MRYERFDLVEFSFTSKSNARIWQARHRHDLPCLEFGHRNKAADETDPSVDDGPISIADQRRHRSIRSSWLTFCPSAAATALERASTTTATRLPRLSGRVGR